MTDVKPFLSDEERIRLLEANVTYYAIFMIDTKWIPTSASPVGTPGPSVSWAILRFCFVQINSTRRISISSVLNQFSCCIYTI